MKDGHTATSLANDGLVARDLNLCSATDGSLHDDHASSLGTGCSRELRQRAHGSGRPTSSTLGASPACQYASLGHSACVYEYVSLPSILCSIADVGSVSDTCSLIQNLRDTFLKCRGWRC